ncbi:hypothetical protein TNCV_1357411 [Trichonephila clavipes]|uniref:Uncharacterized protein n=1 Tax=Trichonephila clavipes TaxID=2585209 RepID=A0A8X6SBI7_TRICX|nr:hypothetical protein TNCV_1357411 [Trichonephila clavipes]
MTTPVVLFRGPQEFSMVTMGLRWNGLAYSDLNPIENFSNELDQRIKGSDNHPKSRKGLACHLKAESAENDLSASADVGGIAFKASTSFIIFDEEFSVELHFLLDYLVTARNL